MKEEQTFEINDDQMKWLENRAKAHGLPDTSKALRCLLDYAIQDGNADEIFDTVRCRHC